MTIVKARKGKAILKKGSKKGRLILLLLEGSLVTQKGEFFAKKGQIVGEEDLYNFDDSTLYQ